jgi:hypothetical protein
MYTKRKFLQHASTLGALLTAGLNVRAMAATPDKTLPTIAGPITGGIHGWPFGGYVGDIGKRNYVEEEYFIAGQAESFEPVGTLGIDGHWSLTSAGFAPYKTRILVRRPKNPQLFNGTVVIEWANISSGYEIAFADPPGLYDGFAYVAVSAQIVGLEGYPSNPQGLKHWDGDRYRSLAHPGDAYSYDIFTQAAKAVGPHRAKSGIDPMRGLTVRKLIATGGSQSGVRLLSYVNAIQPRVRVFDAAVLLVWLGQAAPFDNLPSHPDPGTLKPGEKNVARSMDARVRDDSSIPLLGINTQTEAMYCYPARQLDTSRYVYWEVGGSAHGPVGQLELIEQKTKRDGIRGPLDHPSPIQLSNVMWLPTADAGFLHVHEWINGGKAPPSQPRLQISGSPPAFSFDEYGNVLGGLRLPELEVPVAKYTNPVGQMFPFSPELLKKLYPTHDDYIQKFTAAAAAAEKVGVILPYRVKQYAEEANAAPVPA